MFNYIFTRFDIIHQAFDEDGDELTVEIVSLPQNGTLKDINENDIQVSQEVVDNDPDYKQVLYFKKMTFLMFGDTSDYSNPLILSHW